MYNFIHIPKTGGKSFKTLIKGYEDKIHYSGHVRIADMKTIAFVRNPYDRIVSAYYYIMQDRILAEYFTSIKELIQHYDGINEFILHIEKDNLIDRIVHLKPQCYWVCSDEGTILAYRIFKLEEPEYINEFLYHTGIPNLIGDHWENTSEHPEYKDALTVESIAEINRIYARDFELFNYEMI